MTYHVSLILIYSIYRKWGRVHMKINTSRFGEIEIDEENIIEFRQGIPAFEHLKRYTIISFEDDDSFYWLQSIDDGDIAFILADPFNFTVGYEPVLPDSVLEELKIEKKEDVLLLSMLVIPDKIDNMTANLAAPIVINMDKKLGKQVILPEGNYPIRHPVFAATAREGE